MRKRTRRGRPKGKTAARFLNFCGGVRKCCPKVVIEGGKVYAFDNTGTVVFERQDILKIAKALK